jgi:two-component sensor histidine kinase
MRELSHRSKNLLAIVLSIARQVARQTDDFRTFESAFSARVAALAETHDLLVAQGWRGASVLDLGRAHLAPFGEVGRRIMLQGPDLMLQPKAVEQIGLAMHELATNAAKYGALSGATGRVAVDWSLETDADGGSRLRIKWQECDGPPVDPPVRHGFGYMVLTRVVAGSLQGRATLVFDRGGICWTLDVPVDSAIGHNEEWGAAMEPSAKPLHAGAAAAPPST